MSINWKLIKNKQMNMVEVNVGPQINCANAVESFEINDTTKIIFNFSKVSIMNKMKLDVPCNNN